MKFNSLLFSLWLAACPPGQAIPDQEPEVTARVAALLASVADGAAPTPAFTESGARDLAAPDLARRLRDCPRPIRLELLAREVFGEDRQYVYRAECRTQPLRIAIDFNKAAKVHKLEVSAAH